MSDDLRLERLLADVLADAAPTRVPDQLVPDILAASRRTRRRPRWLALAVQRPMRLDAQVVVGSPTRRLAYLLILALLMTLLAVSALVVGGIVRPPELAVVVVPSPTSELPRATASARPTEPTTPASTGCAKPPDRVRITEVDVPPYATGLQFAACSFWFASGGNGGGIFRFDLATNTITNISMHDVVGTTDELVSGIATRGDEVWAIVQKAILVGPERPLLVRIDPASNTVVETNALGYLGGGISIVDDEAWILTDTDHEHGGTAVLRIVDITTRDLVSTIELPQRYAELLGFTSSAAWLRSPSETGWVTSRIDRRTREIAPGTPDAECAFTDGGIICGTEAGEIHRISPDTNEIVHTVQLDPWREGYMLVRSDGVDVWVLPIDADGMRELFEVDATTGEVVRRVPYEAAEPIDFSVGLGSIWLATPDKPLLRFELPAQP
jgi:hypothetical protein